MCAIISSLTEFKDSSRADIQPSSVSKLTPSPNLRGKDLQHSPSTICLSIKFRFGSCADVWDVEGAIPYHQSQLPDKPEFNVKKVAVTFDSHFKILNINSEHSEGT